MAREYWPCYFSYEDTCKRLTDEELGRLFRALMHFGATGELPDLAGRESVAFDFIADDISRAREKYDEVCRKRSEYGKKGGAATKALTDFARQKPGKTGQKPGKTSQSKEEDKDKDESKGKDKVKKFIPPTLEEVRAYCQERNSSVDPVQFYEYFEAGKWKDAKGQPVRAWKQKLLTWEKFDAPPKREKDYSDLWREWEDD